MKLTKQSSLKQIRYIPNRPRSALSQNSSRSNSKTREQQRATPTSQLSEKKVPSKKISERNTPTKLYYDMNSQGSKTKMNQLLNQQKSTTKSKALGLKPLHVKNAFSTPGTPNPSPPLTAKINSSDYDSDGNTSAKTSANKVKHVINLEKVIILEENLQQIADFISESNSQTDELVETW